MPNHKHKNKSQHSSRSKSKKATSNRHLLNSRKNITMIILCIVIPVAIGIMSNDIVVGGTLLATGLLSSYLAGIGKRSGYIFGIANDLLLAYVAFRNNLFGSFATNVFVFAPIELLGFILWSRNLDRNRDVKPKKLTTSKSLIVMGSCIIGSVLLGYILNHIPGQQLAFMDSVINCLDLCALVLMNLRYKEAWTLWVLSGSIAIVIWTITFLNGGDSALMCLISEISFLAIDTYGAIEWKIKTKNYKKR